MIIDTEGNRLKPSAYTNEAELQEHIFRHPDLLSENEDDKYISIAREVETEAGRIDVLMLSKTGNIVVVEVKLDRNPQSRREIVAQIFDYVSTLSDLSVYELDEKTRGELMHKIEENDFNPQTVDKLLRNADIEIVLAVDESNENLNRIVQFLAMHTDFNISLIEISKHDDNGRTLLTPSTIFTKEEKSNTFENDDTNRSRIIDEIAQAWNKSRFATESSLFTQGTQPNYRQIRIPGWKTTLHYEFTSTRNDIYVRLDNELNNNDANKNTINEVLKKFDGQIINDKQIDVKGNKIYLGPFSEREINTIVDTMAELINLTKPSVDEIASFSRRTDTTFKMLDIPTGAKLQYINNPEIYATVVDDKNKVLDMHGQKRTISNYSNELTGCPTSGFEYFSYHGKRLIDIRNEKENFKGEKINDYKN